VGDSFGTSKQPHLGCGVCALLQWGTSPGTAAAGNVLEHLLPPDLGVKTKQTEEHCGSIRGGPPLRV
jgi:hypothetical protein